MLCLLVFCFLGLGLLVNLVFLALRLIWVLDCFVVLLAFVVFFVQLFGSLCFEYLLFDFLARLLIAVDCVLICCCVVFW